MRVTVWLLGVLTFLQMGFVCCAQADPVNDTAMYEKLVPFHAVKKDPGPFDWLATHEERGQTFSQFIDSKPVKPSKEKPYIYIVTLGSFSPDQEKILQLTQRYVEIYFQMPVKTLPAIDLSRIPPEARRIHPQTADKQILTSYVIEKVLNPLMPSDAYCLIAFSSQDLWPGEGWNFVFGQASMEDRVGVWSIYRNGDPSKGKKEFALCLRRTIQTATHELGHMFGLDHCIYYECNMNGSNSRRESDSRPLWLCPICLRKLAVTVPFDPLNRYRQLIAICREYHLVEEENFFERSVKALSP